MVRFLTGLAGCVLCLSACGPMSTPSGAPAPTAAPAASPPIPFPSSIPSPSAAIGWTLLRPQPELGSAHLQDIATFRDALIVVGATESLDVLWSSKDARVWTSIGNPTALAGLQLRSIAVGDPGIVVVGWSDTAAIALFSPDGTSWSRRELPGSHPGSSAVSVAWGRGGFVAVGGGGEVDATVAWSSPNGLDWTAVTILKSGQSVSLTGVAAGPDAYVVDGMQSDHPVIWRSIDARTWVQTDLPGTPNDDAGRMRYTGGHFIFPITAGGIWSSTDGQHWTKTIVPGFGVGAFDVTAIPGGFVAVGRSSEGTQPGAVAVADPGLTRWILRPEDPLFETAIPSRVTVSPDGSYVVGGGIGATGGSIFLFADPSRLLSP
jgi:hypothetical protein